jgi:hypothetical protein
MGIRFLTGAVCDSVFFRFLSLAEAFEMRMAGSGPSGVEDELEGGCSWDGRDLKV